MLTQAALQPVPDGVDADHEIFSLKGPLLTYLSFFLLTCTAQWNEHKTLGRD
jgi:hypothetical protein